MTIDDSNAVQPRVSYEDMLEALERAQDIALEHATPTRKATPGRAGERPGRPPATH